jgi:hypothetical protein
LAKLLAVNSSEVRWQQGKWEGLTGLLMLRFLGIQQQTDP